MKSKLILTTVLGLIIFLCACKEAIDSRQLKEINEGLRNSNQFIEDDNEVFYHSLENKLYDPQTAQAAAIWSPPATRIRLLSAGIKEYLDTLRTELSKSSLLDKKSKDRLFQKLMVYQQALPEVFDSINLEYKWIQNDIPQLMKGLPLSHGYPAQADSLFQSENTSLTLMTLNKLQNDINLSEHRLVRFCDTHANSNFCGFDRPHPVVFLNSSYVKAGQPVEVSAGVQLLSINTNPVIMINGTRIRLNTQGLAVDSIRTEGKKGKFVVPVKVDFTTPDGLVVHYSKHLEYTVVE